MNDNPQMEMTMSLETFARNLESLIETALETGLPLSEVHDALAVAGMVLDERRPVACFESEPPY